MGDEAAILPANSTPGSHGKGGWFWHFPWSWRISKPRSCRQTRLQVAMGRAAGSGTFPGAGGCQR